MSYNIGDKVITVEDITSGSILKNVICVITDVKENAPFVVKILTPSGETAWVFLDQIKPYGEETQ